MTLKETVKNKKVRFKLYRDGELWYETEDGFEFPVPITDTGTASSTPKVKRSNTCAGFGSTWRNEPNGRRSGRLPNFPLTRILQKSGKLPIVLKNTTAHAMV